MFACRCGHTLLLAHAKAVQLYRLKYQPQQGGRVSMAVSGHWGLPKDPHSSAGVNNGSVCLRKSAIVACQPADDGAVSSELSRAVDVE